MKILSVLLAASLSVIACSPALPVMGDYTVFDVGVEELSGLCMNQDYTMLVSCGDKGVVKTISFEGEVRDVWDNRCDMEGVAVNPATGDIYVAVERAQEIHCLAYPDYAAQDQLFAVQEAVDGKYFNDGLEAVEYYKDDILFIGAQRGAPLWQYRSDGTFVSKVTLSSFASEIAGLCYDPEADLLWVTDSEAAKLFVCSTDGELLASYDISFIENAESVCVDRKRNCIWIGSDEDFAKLYRIDFRF